MNTLAPILADSHRWNHMDGWDSGWMWLWGTLMMAALVGLVVWIVRAANVTRTPPPTGGGDPNARARQILAERYARGDLTTEDYRERLAELDQSQHQ